MIFIKTYQELEQWLESCGYFEDGYVLKIERNPLVITVGIIIKGNYRAHTEKEILCFKITPEKVSSFDCPSDFEPSSDRCIEAIEPLESDQEIGLQFITHLGLELQLIAHSFIISEREILKSVFKPWVSPGQIFAQAEMKEIPKPHFWKEEFKKLGYDIVFRYFGGDAKPIEKVPYPDYTGYFFQFEDRLAYSNYGIFIQFCSIKNHTVSMCFAKNDEKLDSLWRALTVILANIPGVGISCGNSEFTGDEWKQYLAVTPDLNMRIK